MELKYSEILNNQPIFNIGSIGHVAHGKSTLVRSITGVRTQKHSDEQERNITINIGYANAKVFMDSFGNFHTTPSKKESLKDYAGNEMKLVGHISFVDVPGHEAFMSNMISGSAVMNACILVIASNENIPQPQTYEHFEAVKNVDIDKFIILQNKVDLIDQSKNKKVVKDIQHFVRNTIAEDAPIIPSSIQNDINREEILNHIINLSTNENIKALNEKANKDTHMIVIRSFDINRQNTNYDKLSGGVVGGSLLTGNLKIGDYIEMRPGYIIGNKYRPIYAQVQSLQSDNKKLQYALPGGLIGVCLDIDPSIAKNNGMVGQILGHVGKLPEVYNEITIDYTEINRHDNFSSTFKQNEEVMLSINSMNIKANVSSTKKRKIGFKLSKPVCIFPEQKIAIFKLNSIKWVLYATGEFIKGEICESDTCELSVANELKEKNSFEEILIVNDLDIDSKEQKSYDELLENVEFKTDRATSIRIDPPTVKKVNRDSVFTNYKKFIDGVNNSAQEIKYDNYFLDFLKQESSTTCDVSKDGVVMRGNFRNNHIQTIIIKFFNKYKKCETCNSFDSYLYKNNRNLYKKCLDCSSEYCI
jgi:small GTP-binding protein